MGLARPRTDFKSFNQINQSDGQYKLFLVMPRCRGHLLSLWIELVSKCHVRYTWPNGRGASRYTLQYTSVQHPLRDLTILGQTLSSTRQGPPPVVIDMDPYRLKFAEKTSGLMSPFSKDETRHQR